MAFDDLDRLSVDTIRTLSMDAVQRADSGHPGAPMALAPVAYVLFARHLRHDPADPDWPDRDRFVLSCGHASALLYSILHLTGYDLSLDDLKEFRQWGSRTPGHPEHGLTPGVEITTGPLGQGCGSSVGMALAEAHLAARFNRPGSQVLDHATWVLCSDGDLMEGVSAEAASFAGHLGLGKLVWIWDDNRITIEGATDLSFSEDVCRRFTGYGWDVRRVDDANDLDALDSAMAAARAETDRPSLIAVRTHIAFGSPGKQDSASSHGAPLGEEEVAATKRAYCWPSEAPFFVPEGVVERCREGVARGSRQRAEWQEMLAAWEAEHPQEGAELRRRLEGALPETWDADVDEAVTQAGATATRRASGAILNALASRVEELVGGSADLAPSNKTWIEGGAGLLAGAWGERNLHFGVREHAMAAVLNGEALHGGIRPYGATFLVFSDYMRPSMRMAALMELPVIYVFTHDSIGVGEDGPTHQPVEHLAALRTIPGLTVLRPADTRETAAAWRVAMSHRKGPVALILTRQGLPLLDGSSAEPADGVGLGAYVLVRPQGAAADLVLIATGSEVELAVEASATLRRRGLRVQVVSMPSWELFDRQPAAYRRGVLPPGVPTLAVEAGVSMGWHRWVGDRGGVLGLDRFGASAPGPVVRERLGFTVDEVVRRSEALVAGDAGRRTSAEDRGTEETS